MGAARCTILHAESVNEPVMKCCICFHTLICEPLHPSKRPWPPATDADSCNTCNDQGTLAGQTSLLLRRPVGCTVTPLVRLAVRVIDPVKLAALLRPAAWIECSLTTPVVQVEQPSGHKHPISGARFTVMSMLHCKLALHHHMAHCISLLCERCHRTGTAHRVYRLSWLLDQT